MTTNEQDSIEYGDILVPGADVGKYYWPWLIQPIGLEIFFKGSGMEKYPGHPAPEHFPRPKDVLDIEKKHGILAASQRFLEAPCLNYLEL